MSGRVYADPSSNFHPYECDGPRECVHCRRGITPDHDPSTCALCDPEYDGAPNPHWPVLVSDSSRQGAEQADAGGLASEARGTGSEKPA